MGVKKKNTILKVEFPESSAKKKKSDKQLMTDKFTERKAYRFKQSKRIFKNGNKSFMKQLRRD